MTIDFLPYAKKRICVAVSGGMDSVCLLHVFFNAEERYGIALSAVTCEHGIRGEASVSDLGFVKKLCADWNIPLTVFQENVPERARKAHRGIEEEGRIFRYECFEKLMKEGQCDAVATAHHRDDFAETVLFRLARGTSLGGLNAIKERDGIVRPFLDTSRADIERYVWEHNLPYVTDETNGDEKYARNKLRKTVLPALEEVINGAGAHLVSFALRAGEDDAYLTEAAQNTLVLEGAAVKFPVKLPAPLFSRACVLAMKKLDVNRDYTEANLNAIAALGTLQSGKKCCLPFGLEAVREGDSIVVYRPHAPFTGEFAFGYGTFVLGGETAVVSEKKTAGALVADMDAFPADCVIRTRRRGDRFVPFKGKEKSLKDYFTDKKIPSRTGRDIPLVASGSMVYAIFGVEISDFVKITEQTKRRGYLSRL